MVADADNAVCFRTQDISDFAQKHHSLKRSRAILMISPKEMETSAIVPSLLMQLLLKKLWLAG